MTAIFESQQEPIVINKNKEIGKKIRHAFIITLLFVCFLFSFQAIDTINFIITKKQFEFIDETTCFPNAKSIAIVSVIVFIIVLFITSS
jgi:uncharacterized protein with PQ loop repeat